MTTQWGFRVMLTAGSLFSGIGGLDLAATAAGFDIRFQVEIDPFCREVLAYHAPAYWPNARRFADVRETGKHNLEAVDVLFGGAPCQPYSHAGQRRGAADNRHLWPEMLRVVQELSPRCVVFENVPGIVTMVLPGILTDLESAGYTRLRTFYVPATAVGAPHLRNRIFVVAYAASQGLSQRRYTGQPTPAAQTGARLVAEPERSGAAVADPNGEYEYDGRLGAGKLQRHEWETPPSGNRGQWPTQSRVGTDAHGLSERLAGHRWPAGQGPFQYDYEPPRTVGKGEVARRADKVKAIGNAVVPQCAYPFFAAIYEVLSQ